MKALDQDNHFSCHKTLDYDTDDDEGQTTKNTKVCAGFAVIAEGVNHPSQMMRIMEHYGMYDRTKLNMNAPVHKTAKEFIKAQN